MIRAYSRSPFPRRSFHYYNQILQSQIFSPDNYTFNFMVRSCTQICESPEIGFSIHSAIVKYGFELDPHVQSGLIHMYSEFGILGSCLSIYSTLFEPDLVSQTAMVSACAKSGEVHIAREMFDKMPVRDSIAWTAMISGYAQSGRSREALRLFRIMLSEDVKVNEGTLVSVLSACSHLGALDQGRWVHVYMEKNNVRMTVTLGTALVDMYSKCGNMCKAVEVFEKMREKNVYTWSSFMNGLAINGFGIECIEMFDLMKKEGVQPNDVTFVSVLRGCSVAGLVEEGIKHFDSMSNFYGLEPRQEHYGCVVDLYGRAGYLEDAINFIQGMPIKPHAAAWGALLNACNIHGNLKLSELASRKLVELECKNDGAYVNLSNIYAESSEWVKVSNVRKLMKNAGVKKIPGCSVIEVNGEDHEFLVGDETHPRYGEIKVMMGEIARRLRLPGYVANPNPVSFDMEEEENYNFLVNGLDQPRNYKDFT
ncbi:hypothetical protein C5167_042500 [Papaver somniferum]|uniref:DYW domain-containing protein n=2 Tax=Papaver somniferum TaxID=3469 RepID=A0A4Y7L2Z8_PAPSO|nr:hypothetical protein C5167_042500 [Papaver somniferum]